MDDVSTDYHIEELGELSPEIIEQLTALSEVLTNQTGKEDQMLRLIVGSQQSAMLVVRNGSQIVGSVIINLSYKHHYIEARLDDMVISPDVQGHGLGTKLMLAALEWSKTHGADSAELTSRPSREAANKLYQKLGFELRETNVYKIEL